MFWREFERGRELLWTTVLNVCESAFVYDGQIPCVYFNVKIYLLISENRIN